MAICQDPAIPRWTRVPSPYTREDALAWIAICELELQTGRAIDWLAVDATGEVVASVAIQGIADDARGEIGYWVAAPARGRGLATRAVRLVSAWALGELGLRQLEIIAHEDNAASLAVARAAGYAETGETRRAAAGGAARRALRRVHAALEALVEPVDEPGDEPRVDDVRDLGLAVDDVGAARPSRGRAPRGRGRPRSRGRGCRA